MQQTTLADNIHAVLREHLGDIVAKSVISFSQSTANVDIKRLTLAEQQPLLQALENAVKLYIREPQSREQCLKRLQGLLSPGLNTPAPTQQRMRFKISSEADIVTVRCAGRDLARDLGFAVAVQIKIATAISELVRNIVQYVGVGSVDISVLQGSPRGLEICVQDNGPGIANLDAILAGRYQSKTGMGKGLAGTRQLMDSFDIESSPQSGTRIVVRKYL